MAEEFGLLTIGTFGPGDGATYRVWAIDREYLEAVAERLGPPHEEHISTADELAMSNALVGSFETPPIVNHPEVAS